MSEHRTHRPPKKPPEQSPKESNDTKPRTTGFVQNRSTPPENELLQSALRANLFLRTLGLVRLSLTTSSRFASDRLTGFFSSEANAAERLQRSLLEQSRSIARELGQLKGSAMKVGQMISIYGEHFLPPEANAILKTLQCQAPPLEWESMRNILAIELGDPTLAELEIAPSCTAAASIGQVHEAHIRASGEKIALKIQYPGVDRAVRSDLKVLKASLAMVRAFSQIPHLDKIFIEVQEMLAQELDYRIEADNQDFFRNALSGDDRYWVPKIHRSYSGQRVLATEFIEGVDLDGGEITSLPQARRDRIADALLDLYFREIFELRAVQTDPHFGNYKVRLSTDGASDRLVLLDFGAVRRFTEDFRDRYRDLTRASLSKDDAGIVTAALALGFLEAGDPPELLNSFAAFCCLVMEPFTADRYDWRSSDLLKRLANQLSAVIRAYRFRPPPREIFFLDRKSSGVFTALTVLGARIDGRATLDRYLSK